MILHIATPDDTDALLDYAKKLGQETPYLSFGPEGLPYTHQQMEHILTLLQDPRMGVIILPKDNDQIIGIAQLIRLSKDHAELAIALSSDYRHRGIGSALLDQLLFFGTYEMSVNTIELDVVIGNDIALHLYEKKGFTIIDTRIVQGQSCYHMIYQINR